MKLLASHLIAIVGGIGAVLWWQETPNLPNHASFAVFTIVGTVCVGVVVVGIIVFLATHAIADAYYGGREDQWAASV